MCWLLLVAAFLAWPQAAAPTATDSCFLLYETGIGEVRRNPSSSCTMRMSPQSTFKIPHAIAALDAGVLAGPDTLVRYDGTSFQTPLWRRDHTLATAIRDSVVWYFQEIARRLGPEREQTYLDRFQYGNRDPSSGLTTFWLGGSLAISPEEELQFLRKLFADELLIKKQTMQQVRTMLVQPEGRVTNATGEHPFAAPWPAGTIVSAKTGAGRDRSGRQVRWLVGHIRRGSRSWLFVSNVIGPDSTSPLAAVDLAASALRQAGVLEERPSMRR